MRSRIIFLLLSVFTTTCYSTAQSSVKRNLSQIVLPHGFEISIFSDAVSGARSLAYGEDGTIFVGTRGVGSVYALTDSDGDSKAEVVRTILNRRNIPNGVAFQNGDLYIAEINRVLRLENIESNLDDPPPPEIIRDGFPSDRLHGWKYIAFGPDGLLYVPVGAPCNVCEPPDWRYSTILRMTSDGDELEVFASGIRNTVGFDWHPETGELWFTDNGRDWLGDNLPPDELNRAPKPGLHFGYPYLHGLEIKDPDFWDRRENIEMTLPEQELGPHVAALGMDFYEGDQFPQDYKGDIFIAEHGSWNRSVPIGYRVTRVKLEGGRAVSYEVFAEGWLNEGSSWGRPVDVLELPDGSILVSDDKAGAIYLISYTGAR